MSAHDADHSIFNFYGYSCIIILQESVKYCLRAWFEMAGSTDSSVRPVVNDCKLGTIPWFLEKSRLLSWLAKAFQSNFQSIDQHSTNLL